MVTPSFGEEMRAQVGSPGDEASHFDSQGIRGVSRERLREDSGGCAPLDVYTSGKSRDKVIGQKASSSV
jgi:hypothetical protein